MAPLPPALRVLATWSGILPVALATQLALAPLATGWPPPLATVAVLTIAVPTASLCTVPLAMRLAIRLRARPMRGADA